MRLTKYEIDSIKSTVTDIFREDAKVILFGSRTRDDIKGGDIDLYIIPKKKRSTLKQKIDFLVALKSKIGYQKIDVVIAKDASRLIEKEALNGIEL